MKKRFLAILLTVVMVLALAVPAAAVTVKETKLDQVWHPETYIGSAGNHLVKTTHNGLYGYVNYNDIPVVQAKYNTLKGFSEGVAAAEKDGSWVYVDTTGKEVITLGVAKEAFNFSCGLARVVTMEGYTYFIDHTGKSVIDCGKNSATDFFNVGNGVNLARVTTPAGKIGQINDKGVEVTHFMFDEIRDYSCGLAYWRIGTRQGFLNTAGWSAYEAAPTTMLNIGADVTVGGAHGDYSDNMVIVESVTAPIDSRIGYFDITGYQAVHCQYLEGDDFVGGVARIKRGNYIDSTGVQVINGYGYIDHYNKYTVQPRYRTLDRGVGVVRGERWETWTVDVKHTNVVNGVSIETVEKVQVAGWRFGYINNLTPVNGALDNDVTAFRYGPNSRPYADSVAYVERVSDYSADYVTVAKGFVNQAGQMHVNAGMYYDSIGNSSEGKAWVVKNGKWGYIETRSWGALVIPMIYDVDGTNGYPALTGLSNFRNGIAVACYGNVFSGTDAGKDLGRYGIIDASGNWLTSNQYTWFDEIIYADRVALARYNGNKIRFVFY